MRNPKSGLKIVSGGQTGADRAALDWAIAHGIPHGGWCPKGRKAEDGPIDARYQLQETPSEHYFERTLLNLQDSDGTVVFSIGPELSGRSKKTVWLAQMQRKPVLHISRDSANQGDALLSFVRSHGIRVLNVTGPRSSKEPEVAGFVTATLETAWAQAGDFGVEAGTQFG